VRTPLGFLLQFQERATHLEDSGKTGAMCPRRILPFEQHPANFGADVAPFVRYLIVRYLIVRYLIVRFLIVRFLIVRADEDKVVATRRR
jgi:hypothetical protein